MTLLELISSCFIILILSSIVRTFLFHFALDVEEVSVVAWHSILPSLLAQKALVLRNITHVVACDF